MAETKDFGRLFVHMIRVLPGTVLVHRAQTVEIEPPYRFGRPLVIRLPFGRALVIGWWLASNWDEEEALFEAVSGWGIDPYDEEMDDDTRQSIREHVAASGMDLEDEWKIISALGAAES